MDLILPMLFLELGFVFLVLALVVDRKPEYDDMCSILLILSIVVFIIAGAGMYNVTESAVSTYYNETSGLWVNNTITERTSEYEWLALPSIGLAFFVLALLFIRLLGKMDLEE